MEENNQNMTFKGLYDSLKIAAPELRDLICKELCIAYETFYYKLRNDSFTETEKSKISIITGRPCAELFPEKQPADV
jgi:hypothetical protein